MKKAIFFAGLFALISGIFASRAFAYGNLSVSQSNLSIGMGQSATINLYLNAGEVANVTSITNTGVASANVSGSTLYIYGQSAGTTQIGVCTTNQSCAYISVNVGNYGGGGGGYGNVSLSQSNATLNVGQTMNISIYGYGNISNYFYVSSNTNSNAVTTSISGSNLTIYGLNSGNATITVCASNVSYGNCASLYVTVSGYASGSGLSLSQTYLNLSVGQTGTITAYNNYSGGLNISSNSNSYVASAYASGNQINIYANTQGSTNINICSSYNYQCQNVYVTVSGYGNYYNYYGSSLYFSAINPPQASTGQYFNYAIQVSGGYQPYSFALNSGALPPGLNMSSSGVISGSPTQAGNYNFTVRVTDNAIRTAISGTITINVSGGYGYNNCQYYPYYGNCQGQVAGTSIYNNGTLINENGTIYIVYKNTKTGFANYSAFTGLGYSANNVLYISNTGLFNSNYIVQSSQGPHPWGSWIKSGNTIYFVHENGLIPISAYDIFSNNGGQNNLVVSANSYDFNKAILPIMDFNDYRLK